MLLYMINWLLPTGRAADRLVANGPSSVLFINRSSQYAMDDGWNEASVRANYMLLDDELIHKQCCASKVKHPSLCYYYTIID